MGKTFNVLLGFIAVLLSVMALYSVGPALETRFNPVYSRFNVVSTEATDGGTIAVFSFNKYRRCEPRGWAWYIGEFGAISRQIEAKPAEDPQPGRPLGPALTVPYFIAAEPDDVRQRMFAEIYSDCHRLWLTRSIVYP